MSIKIYLNAEKTSAQIINPTKFFDGDVQGLVDAVTHNRHFGFEILK